MNEFEVWIKGKYVTNLCGPTLPRSGDHIAFYVPGKATAYPVEHVVQAVVIQYGMGLEQLGKTRIYVGPV